ncbi:MAG TPA: hypothetical protein VHA06_18195, partial [Candidatus Angelobacter sp.]|nr:hypothetical protein [Candidatus Angelobacter sp.]
MTMDLNTTAPNTAVPNNAVPNNVAPRAAAPTSQAAPAPISTNVILASMLQVSPNVSDLVFSPGKPAQVELSGKLSGVKIGDLAVLTADDTKRIAADLMAGNLKAQEQLKSQGACDLSYSVPGKSRFRVNIFMQRGTCAIVMRV